VLVALVDQGPYAAIFMLLGVIAVQQFEGHVLQPFLMGRFVSIHPLGIIVAIGAGVLIAGVAGALVAVPFAAALNAVVQHLAGEADRGQQSDGAVGDDLAAPPPELVADFDPEDPR
jgi:predicted PurR-regulated permease PerM